MTNIVDEFPCLRCQRLESGESPPRFDHGSIKRRQFRKAIVGLVVAGLVAVGASYSVVARTKGREATNQSCSKAGEERIYVGALTDQLTNPPKRYQLSGAAKAIQKTDIAQLLVNDLDSEPQRERDVTQALTNLYAAEFSEAAMWRAMKDGKQMQSIMLAFPTSACAEKYVRSTREMFSAAVDRLYGKQSVISEPGGTLMVEIPNQNKTITARLVFARGAYVSVIEGNDPAVIAKLAKLQASYTPL